MHINEVISTLMAFLVLCANFATICHAGGVRSAKIHSIAETCENHGSGRNADSHTSAMDERPYEICTDHSPLGEFIIKDSIHVGAIVPPPPLITDDLFVSVKFFDPEFPLFPSPVIPDQRSTVLRI